MTRLKPVNVQLTAEQRAEVERIATCLLILSEFDHAK